MSPSALREMARRAGVGRALWQLYHRPIGALRTSVRQGGPLMQWRTEQQRRAMERAAHSLSPFTVAAGGPQREVHFLTGRKYWYQSLFCYHSLQRVSDVIIIPVLHDDGTLRDEHIAAFRRVVKEVRVVSRAEIEETLDAKLPAHQFPVLRARRLVYPHLRKLTDVHAAGDGWKLVLDSDMLFFRRPSALLDWLHDPQAPLHMVDAMQSYGYSTSLMAELAGRSIPDKVNVGICGLRSADIDWAQLEHWCRVLMERESTSYLQEQALTAMLVASAAATVAPASDYVTMPAPESGSYPRAVAHHYVADTKSLFYRNACRLAHDPEWGRGR